MQFADDTIVSLGEEQSCDPDHSKVTPVTASCLNCVCGGVQFVNNLDSNYFILR